MIARACYVMCDACGWPAPVATEGSKEARQLAKDQGFTRSKGSDYCLDCSDRRLAAKNQKPTIGGGDRG